MPQNTVEFSQHFIELFSKLSESEQDLISAFVFHFKEHGLKTFQGKKGPTDNVPHADLNRRVKIEFAKKHRLWHAHIGHPQWNPCRNPLGGYKTSEYVVHFQKFSDSFIALVDYNKHNPMLQPRREHLFRRP
ncbi:hypothetical protein NPS42_03780 [Pseudomonas putida]|uniref:hypothetical protein n=1 Tax=Pseudomonas putida TaxID=303 RepID=UPI00236446DF|nr:hypothetical protein [Pseudomonas putida]MDD2024929.1 hypothetical protein [Pseudomonas putida]HDS1765334.1 hypothetical protein [Pseudomonas putida]